jgi:hypothetical protein
VNDATRVSSRFMYSVEFRNVMVDEIRAVNKRLPLSSHCLTTLVLTPTLHLGPV